jgi:hypothetical protein
MSDTKYCTRCKQTKLKTEFGKWANSKDLKRWYCTSCEREYGRLFREKNRDKINATIRKSYWKHRVKRTSECREKNQKIKREVLTKYGNGECKCVLCGFTNIIALSLDHTNNNGSSERKKFNRPQPLYRHLIKNNFPEGYRTLCMNCQFIERQKYYDSKSIK